MSPCWAPASSSISRSPVTVSTGTVAPSIAVVAVTSSDRDEIAALAVEAVVVGDLDLDVEVAGGPAGARPASPAPEIRIRWPFSIPGGTSTS